MRFRSNAAMLAPCTVLAVFALLPILPGATSFGQAQVLTMKPEVEERVLGPYDVHVLEGGKGLAKAVPPASRVLEATGS